LRHTFKIFTILFLLVINSRVFSQPVNNPLADEKMNSNNEKDIFEVARKILHLKVTIPTDTARINSKKIRISALPSVGYSLQTNFAIIGFANAAFYTYDLPDERASTILTSVAYTSYNQLIFPIQANFWTKHNDFNIVTDWRYMYYPSFTYGLGGYTKPSDGYMVDYSYLKLHQTVLKSVADKTYIGLGYDLDYYWNINEENPPAGKVTDFQRYGLKQTSVSSGISVNVLYDSRENTINPDNGWYATIAYRPHYTFMGSDANWAAVVGDFRKYFKLPTRRRQIIALWNYDWLSFGNTPYLQLPSTGWDPFVNTGRGYIQGRFRGKRMLYLESEYRIDITNNGLIGAVLFANAESFSEEKTNRFETVAPGYGAGIRIKMNKHSRTNLAIDYGFGLNGSRGFFVNLGEVF
jgi:hypothetical protein